MILRRLIVRGFSSNASLSSSKYRPNAPKSGMRITNFQKIPKWEPAAWSPDILGTITELRNERIKKGTEGILQQEVDNLLLYFAENTKSDRSSRKSKTNTDGNPSASSSSSSVDLGEKEIIDGWAYGKGSRKRAVAQVWIRRGTGLNMLIKQSEKEDFRNMVDYFVAYQLERAMKPFFVTNSLGRFDVKAIVQGGGLMGQAGAISLGISRALMKFEPFTRPALKKSGLVTRDPREVERKKPGQKKARKKFQWVKR